MDRRWLRVAKAAAHAQPTAIRRALNPHVSTHLETTVGRADLLSVCPPLRRG
jgi:hypothetical protein